MNLFEKRRGPRRSLAAALAWMGAVLAIAAASPSVRADSPARKASAFASGSGNILYLTTAVALPLLTDGRDGKNHSLRVLDALGTSVLFAEAVKNIVREKRPDANTRDSFPSGHVTAAFAVAAVESQFHPRQAVLWYAGAGLISYSRLRLNRHYVQDVVAGAALGYGTARLELSQPRGLVLRPFITPTRGGAMIGMGGTF